MSLTVRFVTLLRPTVVFVTVYREECDLSPFFTVLFVTDDLPFCDYWCSLRPSPSTLEFVTFDAHTSEHPNLPDLPNCDLLKHAKSVEQERIKERNTKKE